MIKNIALGIGMVFFGFNSLAQNDSAAIKPKPKLSLTQLDLNMGYGSNHITTGMVLPFALNGEISNKHIEKSTNLLMNSNRTGFNSGVSAKVNYGKKKFQIGYENYAGWAYSDALFQLVFEGNAKYAGKQMDLRANGKQMRFFYLNYQLGGTRTKLTKSDKTIAYHHSVGLYGINNFVRARTFGENFITTSESGIDIDARLNYQFITREERFLNGAGAGYNLFLYQRKKRSVNVLKISHLGLAYIAPGTENSFAKDTAWNFSGIGFSIGNNTAISAYSDTIQNMLYNRENSKGRISLLPVNVSLESQSDKREIGVNYIAMPGYLPAVHYLKKFEAKGKYNYAIGAQAGGWGLVNSYLKFNWFLKPEKSQKLQFQLIGLESIILPYGTMALSMRVEM